MQLEARLEALEILLAGISRGIDPNTNQDTLTFTNMNVQIVSGSGITNGATNGKGNLIIGYNELRSGGNDRNGSHMLVIGRHNNYTSNSFGGIVAGYTNTTAASYSSVSGGFESTASGNYSSVIGGWSNTASGQGSSISGGYQNVASFPYSSVSGGNGNEADGAYSSISGGFSNTTSAYASSVSGGLSKTAATDYCVVGDDGVDC